MTANWAKVESKNTGCLGWELVLNDLAFDPEGWLAALGMLQVIDLHHPGATLSWFPLDGDGMPRPKVFAPHHADVNAPITFAKAIESAWGLTNNAFAVHATSVKNAKVGGFSGSYLQFRQEQSLRSNKAMSLLAGMGVEGETKIGEEMDDKTVVEIERNPVLMFSTLSGREYPLVHGRLEMAVAEALGCEEWVIGRGVGSTEGDITATQSPLGLDFMGTCQQKKYWIGSLFAFVGTSICMASPRNGRERNRVRTILGGREQFFAVTWGEGLTAREIPPLLGLAGEFITSTSTKTDDPKVQATLEKAQATLKSFGVSNCWRARYLRYGQGQGAIQPFEKYAAFK